MSNDPKDNNNDNEEQIAMPDFTELWKEAYFQAESTWGDAIRKFTNTKMFSQFIDNLLIQHLSMEKITRQSIDLYMENAAVPSKKDVARVAELVVSLEDKIDNIEFDTYRNMQSMANSLLKLVEVQEQIKNDIASYYESLKNIEKKLDDLNNKSINAPIASSGQAKPRNTKKSNSSSKTPAELTPE